MNIVILGQQGSGKGTQAKLLAEKFDWIHIDMGMTLREVAKMDTGLGREIYAIQNVTKTLVPSRILREVLHLKLGSIPREQGIVFDGVPRTLDQSAYIEEALHDFGRELDKAFFINISEAESVRRIYKRWTCEDCRAILIMGKDILSDEDNCPKCQGRISQRIDDTPDGIRKRLAVFNEETLPVIENYRQAGVLIEINGEQAVEKVFENIVKQLL
jgi:adenylate kinase